MQQIQFQTIPSTVYGWTSIEGIQIPYILRNGQPFVPVKTVERQLLSQYQNLSKGNVPDPIPSYPMTDPEAAALRTLACDQMFTSQDLLVNLESFLVFCESAKKISNDNRIEKVDGGWVQINNTIIPYVVKDDSTMVALSIVRCAAGLLNGRDVPVMYPNDEECEYLNSICKSAGIEFFFTKTTELVEVVLMSCMCDKRPFVRKLPKGDPFILASFIDGADENVKADNITTSVSAAQQSCSPPQHYKNESQSQLPQQLYPIESQNQLMPQNINGLNYNNSAINIAPIPEFLMNNTAATIGQYQPSQILNVPFQQSQGSNPEPTIRSAGDYLQSLSTEPTRTSLQQPVVHNTAATTIGASRPPEIRNVPFQQREVSNPQPTIRSAANYLQPPSTESTHVPLQQPLLTELLAAPNQTPPQSSDWNALPAEAPVHTAQVRETNMEAQIDDRTNASFQNDCVTITSQSTSPNNTRQGKEPNATLLGTVTDVSTALCTDEDDRPIRAGHSLVLRRVRCFGKRITCMLKNNQLFILMEAMIRLYFPVHKFSIVLKGVLDLGIPIAQLTADEERDFTRFYKLPAEKLNCNKIIDVQDFIKNFEKLNSSLSNYVEPPLHKLKSVVNNLSKSPGSSSNPYPVPVGRPIRNISLQTQNRVPYPAASIANNNNNCVNGSYITLPPVASVAYTQAKLPPYFPPPFVGNGYAGCPVPAFVNSDLSGRYDNVLYYQQQQQQNGLYDVPPSDPRHLNFNSLNPPQVGQPPLYPENYANGTTLSNNDCQKGNRRRKCRVIGEVICIDD